ncbi:MAG: LacI family DNA-binding transcriptional regulator [Chloroflexota bacterium]|nr:LacI family DNA-binding transcriptional regulator [Chloroflexota bacterium]
MASMKDVAFKAGVSVATVSRVLADKPHIRPEIRALVLQVVEELNYRPNRLASNLRRQTSQVIGVLVGDIRNPFFTAMARAIEDVAHRHALSIFLCNTDESPEKEQHYLETLLDENVGGIIFVPTREQIDGYHFLLESDAAVVTIDRRIMGANIDTVLSDNVRVAHALTAHLIGHGHRRIAAVFGLQESTTGRERMDGYRAALIEAGIAFDPEIATYTTPREEYGQQEVARLLALSPQPDAILTGNSRLTIGALNAIREAGLSIPDHVALAGFDETPWMSHVGLGITVISQPTYEMGQTAAELLLERMRQPDRPTREIILNGSLLARGSSGR